MEFKHEEKNTPTFRQWAKSADCTGNDKFDVTRIFCNSDWRAITFVTELFRISRKFSSTKEYETSVKGITKIVTSHCRVFITVRSKEQADISLVPASDADESPHKFESDDFGFVKIA